MPETVSGKTLCRILRKHGWILVPVRGSRHVLSKEGSENLVVVPVHGNRDLKTGLLRSLLRAAWLEETDLER